MTTRDPMQVVVLCGGLGTRLRPAVQEVPKVLAPVAGRPFLDYLLTSLSRQGFSEIVLSTGYRGEQIAGYAGDGSRWGVQLRYAREPEPLGTGGALLFAAEAAALRTPFLAMNGDTFFSGSLERLADFHRTTPEAEASLALARVARPDRYGTVTLAEKSGKIAAFREKDAHMEGPAWINAGVYVLGQAVIDAIPPAQKISLERQVFPEWIGRGLYGCPFPEAAFLDIGTPEDYARAPAVLNPS